MENNKKIFRITKEHKVFVNGTKATYFNKKITSLNHILKEIYRNDKTIKKQDCVVKLVLNKNSPLMLNYKNNKDDFDITIDKFEEQKKIEILNIYITFNNLPELLGVKSKDLLSFDLDSKDEKSTEQLSEIRKLEVIVKDLLERKIQKETKEMKEQRELQEKDNENNDKVVVPTPPRDYWDVLENIIIKLKENFRLEDNTHIILQLNDNLKRIKDKNTMKIREPLLDTLKILSNEITNFFNLRELKLCQDIPEHNVINYDDVKALEEIVMSIHIHLKIKNLTELELNQFYILNDNFIILAAALKVNTSIKKLSLSSNKIGVEGCWSLNRVFTYNKTLLDLDLSYNFLTDDCIRVLTNLDSNEKCSLLKLNLSNNPSITQISGAYIASFIPLCPNLINLNISKTLISNGFLQITSSLITHISKVKLQTLIVFGTKLDNDSIYLFCDYIQDKRCKLKSLVLSDNNLNNKGGDKLFDCLCSNESLEELYLFSCNLELRHAEKVCKLIAENKSLEKIYLYKNGLGESNQSGLGLKGIIFEIVHNYYNKDGYNKIKSKLLNKTLPHVEPYHSNLLQFFKLCENKDDGFVISLEKNVKHRKSLKVFDISKNGHQRKFFIKKS